MVIGGLLKAIKHLTTLARVGQESGRIPILNAVLKAAKNPKVSRREFLSTIGGGTRELMAQSNYLASIDKLNRNAELAKIALLSPSNQKMGALIKILDKKVKTGAVTATKNAILRDAKKLGKSPTSYKKARKDYIENRKFDRIGDPEDVFHLEVEYGRRLTADELTKIANKYAKESVIRFDNMPKSKRLRELAEDRFGSTSWGSKIHEINKRLQKKHKKNLELTDKDIRKYNNLVNRSETGHDINPFKDPDMKIFDKAKKKFREVTGATHYEATSLHRGAKKGVDVGGRDFYKRPGYKGIDVDKTVTKEVTKEVDEITSPIKDIWSGLKKAWDEGMAGE